MSFNIVRPAKPEDFKPDAVFFSDSETPHHVRVIEAFGRGDFICVSELSPGSEIVLNRDDARHFQLCEQVDD